MSVEKSLRVWQALRNQPSAAASLSQIGLIRLRLGDLAAAARHAVAARQIQESLGLNDVWMDYDILFLVRNIPTFCPDRCP